MKEFTTEPLEVRQPAPRLISYCGTRDELLAAGVALSEMFPEPPGRRRWARNQPKWRSIARDDWTVSLMRDGRWRVTRERGWQDPDKLDAERAADAAHTQAVIAAWQALRPTPTKAAYDARQGAMTAEGYRTRLLSLVSAIRRPLAELMAGAGAANGYRVARDTAEDVIEQLDQAIEDLQAADIERPGALDGLAAPLAACLRGAMTHRPRSR